MSAITPTANVGARDGVSLDAAVRAALDLLNTGVLLLSPELVVAYAKERWSRWAGAPVVAGTPLTSLVEDAAHDRLGILKYTLRDGGTRSLQLWMKPSRADAPSSHV